jgi:hypothetical protein
MGGPFGLGLGTIEATSPAVDQATDQSGELAASLVLQLRSLYEEKQELEAALGVSTSSEIISMFGPGRDNDMLQSLTDQLFTLYTENQQLENAIGCSDAAQIITMVTELRSSIRALVDDSRRRLMYEANVLETHERFLV